MFTIAAQIVLHSVVEAMDWRNNVYVPCAHVVNIFCHCYCDIVANIESIYFREAFCSRMPGSDTRTSAQKATINWHPGWLGERDACGDLVGDWAQYLDCILYLCWVRQVWFIMSKSY